MLNKFNTSMKRMSFLALGGLFLLLLLSACVTQTHNISNDSTPTTAQNDLFWHELDRVYRAVSNGSTTKEWFLHDVAVASGLWEPFFVEMFEERAQRNNNVDEMLLLLAAYSGHSKLFKKIIKKYKTPVPFKMFTPMTLAMTPNSKGSAREEIIGAIVKRWGVERFYAANNKKNLPMSVAARFGDISLAKLFIKKKIDPKYLDGHSLVVASNEGHPEFIRFLVSQWGLDWVSDENLGEVLNNSLFNNDLETYNFIYSRLGSAPPPTSVIVGLSSVSTLEQLKQTLQEIGKKLINEGIKRRALVGAIENKKLDTSLYLVENLHIQQIPIEAFQCAVAVGELALVKRMLSEQSFYLLAEAETSCGKYEGDGVLAKGMDTLQIAQTNNHPEIAKLLKEKYAIQTAEDKVLAEEEASAAAAEIAAQRKIEEEAEKRLAEAAKKAKVKLDKKIALAEGLVPSYEIKHTIKDKRLSAANAVRLHKVIVEGYQKRAETTSTHFDRDIVQITSDASDIHIGAIHTYDHGKIKWFLLALKYNDIEFVKMYLEDNPSLNNRNYWPDTPFIYAVEFNNSTAIPLMIEAWGAEKAIKGRYPKSTLDMAIENKQEDVAMALIDAGAYASDRLEYKAADAILQGVRDVAVRCLAAKDIPSLSADIYRYIFEKAMEDTNYTLATEVADKIDKISERHLFIAIVSGNTELVESLMELDGDLLDLTSASKGKSYFVGYDSSGKSAIGIAEERGLTKTLELLTAKQSKNEEDQRIKAVQKAAIAKSKELSSNRKSILESETPYTGKVKVAYKFRKGNLGGKPIKWWAGKVPGTMGDIIGGLRASINSCSECNMTLVETETEGSYDVLLSLKYDRTTGWKYPVIINATLYGYEGSGEIAFDFTKKEWSISYKKIGRLIGENLRKAIQDNSSQYQKMVSLRDEAEARRVAQVKAKRKNLHSTRMESLFDKIKTKNYSEALGILDDIDREGIVSNEQLGFLKGFILLKDNRKPAAKTIFETLIYEYPDSDSKYIGKAQKILKTL